MSQHMSHSPRWFTLINDYLHDVPSLCCPDLSWLLCSCLPMWDLPLGERVLIHCKTQLIVPDVKTGRLRKYHKNRLLDFLWEKGQSNWCCLVSLILVWFMKNMGKSVLSTALFLKHCEAVLPVVKTENQHCCKWEGLFQKRENEEVSAAIWLI